MKSLALAAMLLSAGCGPTLAPMMFTYYQGETGKRLYAYCADRYPQQIDSWKWCQDQQANGLNQQNRFAARHGLTDESLPAQIAGGNPAATAWLECGEQWGRDESMVGYCLMQADNYL